MKMLVFASLLAFGTALAQDDVMSGGMMSGGMMSGGMMSGGASMDQSIAVTLSGDQQVPSVVTDGTGSATVSLEGNTLAVNGDFSGLSSPLVEVAGSSGHIHLAPAGENGDVIFPLNVSVAEDGSSGIFSLTIALTPEQINAYGDAFNAGELYLNFHTEANQGGEIRGQIMPGM